MDLNDEVDFTRKKKNLGTPNIKVRTYDPTKATPRVGLLNPKDGPPSPLQRHGKKCATGNLGTQDISRLLRTRA